MLRLTAYGVLLLVALKAASSARIWARAVDEFIAISTEVVVSPWQATRRACQPRADPCRVKIAAGGIDACQWSRGQLNRKRQFQVSLDCHFTWLAGLRQHPRVSIASRRLTLERNEQGDLTP